jgi:uncharacterized protein
MKFLFGSQHINRIKLLIAQAFVLIIRIYQALISPMLGSVCRFSPSCSQYAIEAIQRYGLIKGLWLAGCRLLRCHPWNPGGFDPVP